MPRVLIVGSSNLDLVARVPTLPRPGETVAGGTFFDALGGKGANQAVAAVRNRRNAEVAFVACVGRDSAGDRMVAAFDAEGLDTSHIKRCDAPTGTALIFVDDDAENCIAVCPGANAQLEPGDAVVDADIVVLQMETPAATVTAAIESASSRGSTVLLNYAPVGDASVPLSDRITYLVVNETEAAMLLGEPSDAPAMARSLQERGPLNVVITLGKAGCVAVGSDGRTHTLPAHRVEPVDTTAAGDTFCGALAVRLAEHDDLVAAMTFATVAAALATTVPGAQSSIPRLSDVEASA